MHTNRLTDRHNNFMWLCFALFRCLLFTLTLASFRFTIICNCQLAFVGVFLSLLLDFLIRQSTLLFSYPFGMQYQRHSFICNCIINKPANSQLSAGVTWSVTFFFFFDLWFWHRRITNEPVNPSNGSSEKPEREPVKITYNIRKFQNDKQVKKQ